MNDRSEIIWAPRVSLARVRALYLAEARGECDEAQMNDLGYALFARCQSILEFTRAVEEGEVRCKRCSLAGSKSIIKRKTRQPGESLRCPACGWQVRWRVYLAESEKVDGQLHASNAYEAFHHFAARWPLCTSPEEKILAIDRLIHEFHWNMVKQGDQASPHKPAGVNLLRGSTTQVMDMLNELSYGEHTPPELLAAREWWRSQKPVASRFRGDENQGA